MILCPPPPSAAGRQSHRPKVRDFARLSRLKIAGNASLCPSHSVYCAVRLFLTLCPYLCFLS